MGCAKENPRKKRDSGLTSRCVAGGVHCPYGKGMTDAALTYDDNPRARLRDPAYFALHLAAIAAIREVGSMGWYDSHFLRRREIACTYLAKVRPDLVDDFRAGFAPLQPAAGFRELPIKDVFDAATIETIRTISRAVPASIHDNQDRENAAFGRDVVWDHPYFLDLQEQVRPRIEALVGTPLTSSYNFLSRYGAQGKCQLHMDHPDSMYTFDYCIDQDAVWPIYLSRTVDWPTTAFARSFDPQSIIADPGYDFGEHLLQPNQALLFCGSSQWHHRRPKVAGGFCHLLFFHYIPTGCEALVDPACWATHFGIGELDALCDLFRDPSVDGMP